MARFLDQSEAVLTLVGMVLPPEGAGDEALLLTGEEQVVPIPRELTPFLTYLTTPRRMSEVISWVQEAGGTPQDLRRLVAAGRLLQVDPGEASEVLSAFTALRVVPLGFPVEVPGASGAVVYVGPEEGSSQVVPISPLLGAALWEQRAGEDLPATTERLSSAWGLGREEGSRLVLTELDALLALRLARLEGVVRGR